MSLTFGFYNSQNKDRRYNANQMTSLFDGIITDGIFEAIGEKFMVSASSGMTVNVGTGRAWFNQTWTLNDSPLPITIPVSELVLNRIDTIVIDVDKINRTNDIFVISGTPASNPSAPTLISDPDSEHYQYPLCDIYVAAGVTEIKQENITNRIGIDSPFVTGAVQSVSVDELVTQWKASFDAWMDALRGILGEEVATSLAQQILNLENTKVSIDGSKSMTGDLSLLDKYVKGLVSPDYRLPPMGDLATPIVPDDDAYAKYGINRAYIDALVCDLFTKFVRKDGFTLMTGALKMSDNAIIQLADPLYDHWAANKRYVDTTAEAAKTRVKLLWKNANQQVGFEDQHITFDDSIEYNVTYDAIYIRCRLNKSNGYEFTTWLTGGLGGTCMIPETTLWGVDVEYPHTRSFIWKDKSIQVGKCKKTGNTSFSDANDYLIPIAIYGIKWGKFENTV